MAYTGTCSGDSDDPNCLRVMRFLGAATGTIGGGYLGWYLTSEQQAFLIVLAVVGAAAFGNPIGSVLGHGLYSGSAKLIGFFKNCTHTEKIPLLQKPQEEQHNCELTTVMV